MLYYYYYYYYYYYEGGRDCDGDHDRSGDWVGDHGRSRDGEGDHDRWPKYFSQFKRQLVQIPLSNNF